jgi:16S rRNA (adenine1518-N6/adenine1519-N6)-dimethyltransferase
MANGARLVAIEKDTILADDLRAVSREPGVEIISGDVLKILVSRFSSHDSSYKIVGNIPYYLTGHLLRIVSELEHRPTRCVFMVQKEVATRMAASSGEMNRLAASVQFWADVKILITVPKRDFSPQPKIDSAVAVIDKKLKSAAADAEQYFGAVRALFAQPRKTILNNLVSGKRKADSGREELSKDQIIRGLKDIQIAPDLRPQDLSIEQIVRIAEIFFKK